MLKSIVRNVLAYAPVDRRLRQYFIETRSDELLSALINDNYWVFSQMKSGTTFLCNSLAFYNALKMGRNDPGFDETAVYGVARNPHEYPREIHGVAQYSRQTGRPWTVQTHCFVPARPSCLIIVTRHVFDYCVSSYHFHYKNRSGREAAWVDGALRDIVDRYIACHHGQSRAREAASESIVCSYEDLMTRPVETLSTVLSKIDIDCDPSLMPEAIRLAGVDRLKQHEAEIGHAVVARQGTFNKAHFVRSGKIGEGREFFSDQQIKYSPIRCAMSVFRNGG